MFDIDISHHVLSQQIDTVGCVFIKTISDRFLEAIQEIKEYDLYFISKNCMELDKNLKFTELNSYKNHKYKKTIIDPDRDVSSYHFMLVKKLFFIRVYDPEDFTYLKFNL